VVDSWFDSLFQTHCYAHGAKKKSWKSSCWKALNDRLANFRDSRETAFPQPELPATAEADETGAAWSGDPGASSSMANDAAMAQGDVTEQAKEEERQAHENFAKRVYEESMCREMLEKAEWLDFIPQDHELEFEMVALRDAAEKFCTTFQWHHCSRFPLEVLNARLLTVEKRRCFDYLHHLGRLPRNVTNPRDRPIRGPATISCSPFFQDPGNFKWDIVYHLLSLNKYVVLPNVDPLIRTAPAEYGDRSNCSSKGPVNFRGNVLEAVLFDLQNMGTMPVEGAKGPPKGASPR